MIAQVRGMEHDGVMLGRVHESAVVAEHDLVFALQSVDQLAFPVRVLTQELTNLVRALRAYCAKECN
jgi:hypothetical protein